MISLRNVSKTFNARGREVRAVDRVDLTIDRGDVFGVIGYSGAGKSTLIRLLNGLEKPGAGQVLVNGADIGAASEAQLRVLRPKIGMIFQHFNLLWSRTVESNIAMPMQIAGRPKAEIKARVAELIRLVGLEGREGSYPSQLSGGQKQRVGIARALANQPDVLLCDEATSALDPETTDQILDLLSQINRDLGLTIVLITHEMHVVRRICNRVAVMEAGRIVEEGPVAQVFQAPQAPITQRFLGQIAAEGITLRLLRTEGLDVALTRIVAEHGVALTLASVDAKEIEVKLAATPAQVGPILTQLTSAGFQVQDI